MGYSKHNASRRWTPVCVLALCAYLTRAALAIVPGMGPTDYEAGQRIPVQVSSLQSVQGILPVDPYDPSLPFCRPDTTEIEENNLGQMLMADRVQNSPYEIEFLKNASCKTLCKDVPMTDDAKSQLRRLVRDKYMFHMIIDQLYALQLIHRTNGTSGYNIGVPVGFERDGRIYIYNHYRIIVYYHGNAEGEKSSRGLFNLPWDSPSPHYRVVRLEIVPMSIHHGSDVSGNLTCGLPPVEQPQEKAAGDAESVHLPSLPAFTFSAEAIAAEEEESASQPDPVYLNFSYDVVFQPSPILWSERWDIYLANARDRPLIHWFSIVNSLVVLLLLSALVAMILLRVLYRDISRYNDLLADEEDAEEKGWKLLHGDVFRKPAHSTVLAALTGSGMQTMLILWTVMGAVAGYTSARMYKLFKSMNWKMTTIRTALVFPGVVFSVFFLMNVVLWSQKSSAAVSFTGLLALLAMWFGISIPLVFMGAYFGFKQPAITIPVRINKIPRQVPQQPWFMHPALCSLVGGALPFGLPLSCVDHSVRNMCRDIDNIRVFPARMVRPLETVGCDGGLSDFRS
ncbi:endomembrane domain70-containing protein [Cyclospora cayetanensis]|uniref:Transmembrane 9 superfamily member n=1 Tax=Cyclospora cayetanensis TaxID=88456 RepID=A0A1D3CZZ0_9EIME|nr:endomembrane domain70-containing protein [Cyclospora cayetanensis]